MQTWSGASSSPFYPDLIQSLEKGEFHTGSPYETATAVEKERVIGCALLRIAPTPLVKVIAETPAGSRSQWHPPLFIELGVVNKKEALVEIDILDS
jgi:hypothetical protein